MFFSLHDQNAPLGVDAISAASSSLHVSPAGLDSLDFVEGAGESSVTDFGRSSLVVHAGGSEAL